MKSPFLLDLTVSSPAQTLKQEGSSRPTEAEGRLSLYVGAAVRLQAWVGKDGQMISPLSDKDRFGQVMKAVESSLKRHLVSQGVREMSDEEVEEIVRLNEAVIQAAYSKLPLESLESA